jgi:hypothetical protein
MRVLALAIALMIAVVVVPVAGAKGLVPQRVCGKSECGTVEDETRSTVAFYAEMAHPEPPTVPYYRIDYRNQGAPSSYFEPTRGLVWAPTQRWFRLDGPVLDALRRAVRELEPFPALERWAAPGDAPADHGSHSLPAASLLIVLAAGMAAIGTFRRRQV